MANLEEKIATAKSRIRTTFERFGHNHVYVGFSGGKDSNALLRLTKSIFPNPIIIHNNHPGESVGEEKGVLCTKEPKARMADLLSACDLRAQLDGTRQSEDKLVRVGGVEVHRAGMKDWYTDNGYFGLHVCFPMLEWTDDEVFQYLKDTQPIKLELVKYSYEGEGELIGTKTAFLRYDKNQNDFDNDPLFFTKKNEVQIDYDTIGAIYINTDRLSKRLIDWALQQHKPVTIEIHQNNMTVRMSATYDPQIRYFFTCEGKDIFPCFKNIFIKIRVLHLNQMQEKMELANWYAREGHQVLLMPEFEDVSLAAKMKHWFNQIHPNVRLMPPVQNLLGIE